MAFSSDIGGQPPYKRGENHARIAAAATPDQVHTWAEDWYKLWELEVCGEERRVERFIDCCCRLAAVAELHGIKSQSLRTFIREVGVASLSGRTPSRDDSHLDKAQGVIDEVDEWAQRQLVQLEAAKSQTEAPGPVNAVSTPTPAKSLTQAIDALMSFVQECNQAREDPKGAFGQFMFPSDVDRFRELDKQVFVLAHDAGLHDALPKQHEVERPLYAPGVPGCDPNAPDFRPVQFLGKTNLPGDWTENQTPNVFMLHPGARWKDDMDALRALAESRTAVSATQTQANTVAGQVNRPGGFRMVEVEPGRWIGLPTFDISEWFDSCEIPLEERAGILERGGGYDGFQVSADLERETFKWLLEHGRPAVSARTPLVSDETMAEVARRFAKKPLLDNAVREHLRRLDIRDELQRQAEVEAWDQPEAVGVGQGEGNGKASEVGLTSNRHSKGREMRKVFISYSHDSAEHCQRVLQFANILRKHGVDVELDRYHVRPPEGWPIWCEKQLRPENSDFVLMICTETYRRRVENRVHADEGRGVLWEGRIIYDYIYDAKGNTRFIPVLLSGASADCIPLPVRNHTRYCVEQFDFPDVGYQNLYRELTGQPDVTKPALGEFVPLGSHPTTATAAPLDPRPVETTFPTPVAIREDVTEPTCTAKNEIRGEPSFPASLLNSIPAALLISSIVEAKRVGIEAGRELLFKQKLLEMGQQKGLSAADAELGLDYLLNQELVRVELRRFGPEMIGPDGKLVPANLPGCVMVQRMMEIVFPMAGLGVWLEEQAKGMPPAPDQATDKADAQQKGEIMPSAAIPGWTAGPIPADLAALRTWVRQRLGWYRLAWHGQADTGPECVKAFLETVGPKGLFGRDYRPDDPAANRRWMQEQCWRFAAITLQQADRWLNYYGIDNAPGWTHDTSRADLDLMEQEFTAYVKFLADKTNTPASADKAAHGETGGTMEGLRSFIVHGHDETAKLALKNYLQNTLRWPEPVILAEKPSGGKTIIEKFEEHSKNIDVVFVLLTPDDMGGAVGSPLATRARQNVILELGCFIGKFGRTSGRVILLHKGDLELPSNVAGIIYIDISNGVEAAGEKIRKEVATLVRIK